MSSLRGSVDLIGSEWRLRRRTQRQTKRKAGPGGSDTPDEKCGRPPCLQTNLVIQHVWESRVKCRSCSHGSILLGGRNREAVVCCYLVQTILTRSACPVFLARQPSEPCLPKRPLTAVLMSRPTSTASVSYRLRLGESQCKTSLGK
jgi:hypothetical protein